MSSVVTIQHDHCVSTCAVFHRRGALADSRRESCNDDFENVTALEWRTVDEQIEVQRMMRPRLAELLDNDGEVSRQSACCLQCE